MVGIYRPQFKSPVRLYRLLEEIGAVRERIQNSMVRVPWVPSLVREARARMAWGSTAIEGCTLSLEAVRALIKGEETPGYPERHIKMAQNYINALGWVQKREGAAHIRETDILRLHKIIAEGAVDEGPVGVYRKQNVRAGLHVAPPWRRVPKFTKELLGWLNNPAKELPAVISSAIFHLRFAEIHPFRDGNGRVARVLATWELYRKGFDTLHIFALDELLLENRSFYIKNLQRVQVEGKDLGGWLEFMAEMVLDTLERVEKRISAIGPAGEEISLTIRQERLLQVLREKGAIPISEIAGTLKITVPGAHYVMKPLIKHGLVVKIGLHRATRYLLKISRVTKKV